MPGLCCIRFLIVSMLIKQELDIRRQELFWSLSGTHRLIFFSIDPSCFVIVIASKLLVLKDFSNFFMTDDNNNDNRQVKLMLNPTCAYACGVNIMYVIELVDVVHGN